MSTSKKSVAQMRGANHYRDAWVGYPLHVQHASIPDLQPADIFLNKTDGMGLLYPRRSHSIFGPSESGKSWVALMSARDLVHNGERVLFFDFEDAGIGEISARLLALGTRPDVIGNVIYVRGTGTPSPDKWEALLEEHGGYFAMTIVDTVNGALAEMGLSGQSTEDVTVWQKAFIEPLMSWTDGAVLLVDHVPLTVKAGRAPNAIGSQAKRAIITGASYRLDVRVPLRPGQVGVLDLCVTKDRPGGVRALLGPTQADGTQHAARITFDATDPEHIRTTVDPPPNTAKAVVAITNGSIVPLPGIAKPKVDIREAIKLRVSAVLERG